MDDLQMEKYLNIEEALKRMGGNMKLLKKVLTTFLDTQSHFEQLQKEIEVNDREAALKSVHAFKGIAGNLSMTTLYELCPPFETILKTDADISEFGSSFDDAYKKTMECVITILPTI